MTTKILVAGALVAGSLLAGTPVSAAIAGFEPNTLFPNGDFGFALTSHGGIINPGVIAGFNPQPEPPGKQLLTLSLLDPTTPTMTNTSQSQGARFLIALLFPAEFGLLPAVQTPPAPDQFGNTGFDIVARDNQTERRHVFRVTLHIEGSTPIDPTTWAELNPQPLPPGSAGQAIEFLFETVGDPFASFSILEDNTLLSFALDVPEPGTLGLLGLGLAGMILARRRRTP